MRGALILLAGLVCLAGCGGGTDTPPPQFTGGTNYAIVTTNAVMGGVPQTGILRLYYYPTGPTGTGAIIWPFLTAEDKAVFDKLVIFNGGCSEDGAWKYFPALLAYAGNGRVVEISQPAMRHIQGWTPGWPVYAFSILSTSNGVIKLDASQRLPIDPDRPKRLEVDMDSAEILQAVQAAQTRAVQNFEGMDYNIAQ